MNNTNICFTNIEVFPDADKNQLVKKLNFLRTNFRKELKWIKDSEKSGTGGDDIVEPTLWYYEEIQFLLGQCYGQTTSFHVTQHVGYRRITLQLNYCSIILHCLGHPVILLCNKLHNNIDHLGAA
jgi:hypothetical protein